MARRKKAPKEPQIRDGEYEPREGCAPALVLTLGGAPLTWHQVVGLPGYFHPEIPTPVGGPGALTLEQALEQHALEGCALKLVEIPEDQVADLRQLQLEQLIGAAAAIDAQVDELDGAEIEQARDELTQTVEAAGAPTDPPAETPAQEA